MILLAIKRNSLNAYHLINIFCLTIFYYVFFKASSFQEITKKISQTKTNKKIKIKNPSKLVFLIRKIIKIIFLSKNCFARSFISFMILKRFGYRPRFLIGVFINDQFKSHSWITIDNHPVLENKHLLDYKIILEL